MGRQWFCSIVEHVTHTFTHTMVPICQMHRATIKSITFANRMTKLVWLRPLEIEQQIFHLNAPVQHFCWYGLGLWQPKLSFLQITSRAAPMAF